MTIDERNDEVNQALETRFSQLNAAIDAHESLLKKMMVPRDVSVMYDSVGNFNDEYGQVTGEYQYFLGLVKRNGEWRLCHDVSYFSYSGPEPGFEWKPLVEESVEHRIKAASHLDKLKEAVVNSKEKLVPELEKAIQTLATTLD